MKPLGPEDLSLAESLVVGRQVHEDEDDNDVPVLFGLISGEEMLEFDDDLLSLLGQNNVLLKPTRMG